MLPVPERGRGPGQSALQDAGLPKARGHPGAAQPVGEEDRAAQRGGGAAGHGYRQRERCGTPPTGSRPPYGQQGVGVRVGVWGGPSRCTCQLWLPKPSGGTASHPRQACPVVSASEKSRGGRVPTALGSHLKDPLVRDPRRQRAWRDSVTPGLTCAGH